MAHVYRVLAADILTGAIREEIPFQKIAYVHQLNAPGTFQGTIGMRHPKATRANLDPGRTAIHVERDGVIVWSGILWTCRASNSGSNPTLTCDAQGWWSYFRRRVLRTDVSYPSTDQTTVAANLVNYAQSLLAGNVGVVVGTQTSGVNINASWAGADRQNIGSLVEGLAASQNGFDFAVDSAWSSGSVASTLNWYYPRRGVRTNQVVDISANATAYEQDIDASATANVIDATGAGSGVTRLIATVADTSQFASYPMLDATVSHTALTDVGQLATAANADLLQAKSPIVTWPSAVTLPGGPDTAIGSFRTGDSFLFLGSDGYIATGLTSYQRVMTWEVDVDEQGSEIVKLTVVPEAVSQ